MSENGSVRVEQLVGRVLCWMRGHKYRVVQEFSPECRRVKCDRCGGDWGMNDDAKALIDWDRDLENMERSFGREIKEPRYSTVQKANP